MHKSTTCTMKTSLPVKTAALTDMLENVQNELAVVGSSMTLEFHPFEIKTVCLRV